MENFTSQDVANLYGLDSWGSDFFAISEKGHLEVLPTRNPAARVDIVSVMEDLQKRRLRAPVLLRFPQILSCQLQSLSESFSHAIKEFEYQAPYLPVFPVKVNQQRAVVESLLSAGYQQNLGLEVGSKSELLGSLGLAIPPHALMTCNGFKDRDYFEIASLAVRMGRKIITVIEKPFELDTYMKMEEEGVKLPWIGVRIKLNSKGSGLWEKSGGEVSKFGLSTRQLLHAIEELRRRNLLDHLKMFHFHIGSQITEIRRLKEAIKEAARVYAKVRKMGVAIEYLNVGGGLGVDYDGSKTSSDASVNYTMAEYANDVVYNIAEVCDSEHVPHPTIVSESGRALVAYHSMLMVDIRGHTDELNAKIKFTGDEHSVVQDLQFIRKNLNVKNYREYYHDAVERRDEAESLFKLGMLDLEDRAKAEQLYWEVARIAVKHSKTAKFVADEFVDLEARLFEKYICNFSVFQSIPDHWALDQLFPVMPAQRLKEKPTVRATLVDITCDSDGSMEKFVDLKDIKSALEVHKLDRNEPYYLAILLIGAYQDTMGDLHNLFGAVNEAEVIVDHAGKTLIQNTRAGDTIRKTLELYGYNADKLVKALKASLQEKVNEGKMEMGVAAKLAEEYKKRFSSYPYLS